MYSVRYLWACRGWTGCLGTSCHMRTFCRGVSSCCRLTMICEACIGVCCTPEMPGHNSMCIGCDTRPLMHCKPTVNTTIKPGLALPEILQACMQTAHLAKHQVVHHRSSPDVGLGKTLDPADMHSRHVPMMPCFGGKDKLPRRPQLEGEGDGLDAGPQGDGLRKRNCQPRWIPVACNSAH